MLVMWRLRLVGGFALRSPTASLVGYWPLEVSVSGRAKHWQENKRLGLQ